MSQPRPHSFADVSHKITAGVRSLTSGVNRRRGRRRTIDRGEPESTLHLAFEATQVGVWNLDLATHAITRTPQYDRIFGYAEPQPSWSFDSLLEHVMPEERDAVRQSCEAAIEAGTWDTECRIRQPSGAVRWIWMRGRVQPAARGGSAGHLSGTIADITERMELQAERERLLASERHARVEADWASNVKDELLATMSHDLRSPLQAILGWSRILRQGNANRLDLERGLETIERNANLQAQLIDNLMDMNRILSKTLEFALEPNVDLTAVIDAAIQFVQPGAEAKGLVIRSAVPPPGSIRVTGDARRLQQALSHLLSNAVKFTPHGGEVEVSWEVRAAEVEIRIRDTGCGIDRELLPRVLERFRRQDSAATLQHRGLGLPIARQLVELHGGSLGASSPGEGQGATFTVTLPAERVVQGAPQAAIGAPAATPLTLAGIPVLAKDDAPDTRRLVGSSPQTEEERILVLDDELELRDLIARFLTREGYAVRCAETIPEAVRMAAEFQPTLLIVDWLLKQGQDGADAIHAVREVLPEVKAIVMSGLPPEQVHSRLGDLEVLDVLEKPFQVGALIEQIQRALA